MPKDQNNESEYFKSILDGIPTPIFIVDDDLRILDSNIAGMNLLPWKRGLIVKNRCGDLFKCSHSHGKGGGCGKSEECKKCIIRNSVKESYKGKRVLRKKARIEVVNNNKEQALYLLVTTAPFNNMDTYP